MNFITPDHDIKTPVRTLSVALVFMPFAIPERPSIQLGLLSEIAKREGHHATCHHLNLELAAKYPETYGGMCTFRGHMTGEWLFSYAAFGDDAHLDDDAYLDEFPSEIAQAARGGIDRKTLIKMRRKILPAFIDAQIDAEDWGAYDVVGFSSTFQQHCASLAMARRLKARWPHLQIVIGGANVEGTMGRETARAFPYVDHVAIGEGDLAFPALLRAISEGDAKREIAGIFRVGEPERSVVPFDDLDSSPIPNYDEYFDRFNKLGLAKYQNYLPALPLETARGCWWGRKHHCTFCGLNGDGMEFRRKTGARALDELRSLSDRYGLMMFQSTDNILDMKYLTEFFPKIEADQNDYTFFFEVKSNVTRAQLAQMRRGGVMWIQPGIESMSTDILSLMEKGCTMLHNVRLLKWSLYYKVRVGWNLLWGFPGETEAHYADEYNILSKIPHLEPPNAVTRLWLERFSPIYSDRKRFPAKFLTPERSYTHIYPPDVDLENLAYFFDYALENTTAPDIHERTSQLVDAWSARWHSDNRPGLWYRHAGDTVWIADSRDPQNKTTHRFDGPLGQAYVACTDTMQSPANVVEAVNKKMGAGTINEADAEQILDMYCEQSLMVGERGLYLGLALPSNPNW